ncbi:MAG TPA: SDR family NAD(P)-dependent oxidoreductase [Ktedonobacterales bacterium]
MSEPSPDGRPDVLRQLSLAGKRALVSGASRGLGRTIALALAEAGADVGLIARDLGRLEAVAGEIRALGRRAVPIRADLSVMSELRQAVEAAYAAFGQLDILVCNAGISPVFKRSVEVTEEEWDAILATNLKATFFLCAAVGKRMSEAGGGSIITLASVASVVGTPRMAAYGASKAAVAQLTRTLALEWAGQHVRVNAIAPGYIETDLTAGLLSHPYWGAQIRDATPLGRVGQPREIAGIAVYLASAASSFATGQLFLVDGGATAG